MRFVPLFLFALLLYTTQNSLSRFFKFFQIVDFLRRIVVFFTAHAYKKAFENQGLLGR